MIDFMLYGGFGNILTDRQMDERTNEQTNERTDIGGCRATFATQKLSIYDNFWMLYHFWNL